MLLGMAASHRGTMNPAISKVTYFIGVLSFQTTLDNLLAIISLCGTTDSMQEAEPWCNGNDGPL